MTGRLRQAWWGCWAWWWCACGLWLAVAAQQNASSDPRAVQLFQAATNLFQNQQYDLALEEFQRVVDRFPKDPIVPRARYQAAVCQVHLEQWQPAIEQFASLLKDEPRFELREEALLNLGWCQLRLAESMTDPEAKRKTAEAATGTLGTLLKDFPRGRYVDQGLYFHGEASLLLGQYRQAAELLGRVVAEFPESSVIPDAMVALSMAQRGQAQWPTALETLETFLNRFQEHPLSTDALFGKAECLMQLNRWDEAAPLFEKLASSDTPLAEPARRYWAYCLEQRGEQEKAAAIYHDLAQRSADMHLVGESLLAAGRIWYRLDQLDKAQQLFQQVQERWPEGRWEAGHWLVRIALKRQDLSSGEQLARQLLDQQPPRPWDLRLTFDLADALAAQPEKMSEALATYERLIELARGDVLAPQSLYAAALVAWQLRQYDRSESLAQRLRTEYPSDPLVADARRILAECLILKQQLAAAESEWTRLIAEYPDHPDRSVWRLRLATVYLTQKQFNRLAEYLEKLRGSWPQPELHVQAALLEGQAYFYREQYDTAVSLLEATYNAHPAVPRAEELLLWAARARQKQQRILEAISLLTTIADNAPNSSVIDEVYYRLGECHHAQGDYAKAATLYQQVISQYPKSNFRPFALYRRAGCMFQDSKFDEAVTDTTRLLEEYPESELALDAILLRGTARRSLRQYALAIEDFRSFAEKTADPVRRADVWLDWAATLNDAGNLQAARELLEKILETLPDYPRRDRAIYDLAWTYRALDQKEAALDNFRKLAEQFPDSPLAAEAHFHLAENHYEKNEFDAAIQQYVMALKSATGDLKEKTLYKLGFSYFQKKDYSNSFDSFERQTREFPDGSLLGDALLMQGETLFQQGKYQEALVLFDKAETTKLASEASRPLLWLHAGQAANELQQWDAAVAWFDKLLEDRQSPLVPEAILGRALALYKLRRFAEAAEGLPEVADQQNVVGLRARFLLGEILFQEQKIEEAHREFRRAMYSYGGTNPPDDMKPWLAKAALEAGRCAEVLLQKATRPDAKQRALDDARKAYQYIVDRKLEGPEATAAMKRLSELNQLRF